MIRKCFNEELMASEKKLVLLSVFFTIFSFCVIFYNRSLYCFNLLFSSGKSGWLWKEPGCWVALNRTGCWMVWKMVPQTTSHALFEMTTVYLNTSFESCSPLVNDSPRSARTHPKSQPAPNRLFCISLGSAVTFLRWSGQICSRLVSSFLRSMHTKNYWNRFIFDRVIPKIKRWTLFGTQCSLYCTFVHTFSF